MGVKRIPDAAEMARLGEPRTHDPEFSGPVVERQCRDILFLLLFILFWIGMIVVTIIAYRIGQPERLIYGVDASGNICGQKNTQLKTGVDMRSKPYLFFGNPLTPWANEICVERCPNRNVNIFALNYNLSDIYCTLDFTGTPNRLDILFMGCVDNCMCFPGYNSIPVLNRCIPGPGSETVTNSTSSTKNVMSRIKNSDVTRQIFADVLNAKYIILACAGITVVLAVVWLLLIRCCAGCMVWTTIFFVCVLSIVVSAFLCINAKQARDKLNEAQRKDIDTTEQTLQVRTLIALAVICTVFTFCLLVVILFMRRRIMLATHIMKEAGRAMGDLPCLFMVPIVIFILLCLFFLYWIAGAIYLASSGEPLYDNTVNPPKYVAYQQNKQVQYMELYWLFGLLWTLALLLGLNEMIIAGSVATWYFTKDNKLSGFPILRTCGRTLRYHLGSLAFGSLLIAIVQFIRIMIEYMRHQLKGKDNEIARFLLRCLGYLFACLDRFLQFITKNAYIMISIYGQSFCGAARDATGLLMRNAFRLIAIDFVGGFLIGLGKIGIMFGTAIAAIFLLRSQDEIVYWAIPWIIIMVAAFAISSALASLYSMAIDTIFLCFCEDSERNDGSFDRPYYMSAELQQFTEDNQRKPETDLGKGL